jgi:hypothetical protein
MGFHKRFITKDGVLKNLNDIDTYLSADALIMDSWSSNFVSDLDTDERVLRNTIKEELNFLSGCPDTHRHYNRLESLSETLLSLKSDPTWLDIHFTKQKLGLQFSNEISGMFEEQVKTCIDKIISYYETK